MFADLHVRCAVATDCFLGVVIVVVELMLHEQVFPTGEVAQCPVHPLISHLHMPALDPRKGHSCSGSMADLRDLAGASRRRLENVG